MITFFLLFPVALVLIWLYWLALPKSTGHARRWRWIDTALLVFLVCLAGILVNAVMKTEFVDAGPIWAEVVAATGAYGTITIGLAIGLILRRRFARNKTG